MNKDEKYIIAVLSDFERELSEKLQESKSEVIETKYYQEFVMNKGSLDNVFITIERDSDGNLSQHFYMTDEKSTREIFKVNADGEISIKSPEFKEYLRDIDLDRLLEKNNKNLKGISEQAKPEEMEETLDGKERKPEKDKDEEDSEKDNENDKGKDEEEKEAQEVERDLEEQGEDLEISRYRKIKDNHLNERIPGVFNNGEENGMAYSNKLNRFVMITKENGQYKRNEAIEPSKMTMKTVISISPDGEKIEKKVPHALMKVPQNPNKEVAVIFDQYGTPEVETVDVLPCQERVSRHLREQGEDENETENYGVRKAFETGGKEYPHEMAHEFNAKEENIKKYESNEGKNEISAEDYIPNTEITWGDLMKQTGKELPEVIGKYNECVQSNPDAEPKEIIGEMLNEYKGSIAPDKNIPGTDMTWGEFMESTGEQSISELSDRFDRETITNPQKSPQEIIDDIIDDYERAGHIQGAY